MKRVELVVRGIVQGVGFRYYCQKQAENLGITGTVRNQPDGSVRLEAQGEEPSLERYVELVRKGPRNAVVEAMDSTELPLKQNETALLVA